MMLALQLVKQLVVRSSKQQVDGIIQMVQEWSREGQVRSLTLYINHTFALVLMFSHFPRNILPPGTETASSTALAVYRH